MTEKNEVAQGGRQVTIKAPNFRSLALAIQGTAPYVMNKFSEKAKQKMAEGMSKPKGGRGGKEPKDWAAALDGAIHYSGDGWIGIPAASFRAAAISACRIVGFKMTLAKLGIFVRPDGFDRDEGSPLVRLHGDYRSVDHTVRLANGVATVTRRPMFDEWRATVVVDFDGDMFSDEDVINLFTRVGLQVGVGEGRPDSKSSGGMGWGTFRITEARRA